MWQFLSGVQEIAGSNAGQLLIDFKWHLRFDCPRNDGVLTLGYLPKEDGRAKSKVLTSRLSPGV